MKNLILNMLNKYNEGGGKCPALVFGSSAYKTYSEEKQSIQLPLNTEIYVSRIAPTDAVYVVHCNCAQRIMDEERRFY